MKAGNLKNEAGKPFLTGVADATQSASGLMSAADKTKLDRLQETFGNYYLLRLPGGTIAQAGRAKTGDDGSVQIVLPVSLTSTVYAALASAESAGNPASASMGGTLTTVTLRAAAQTMVNFIVLGF